LNGRNRHLTAQRFEKRIEEIMADEEVQTTPTEQPEGRSGGGGGRERRPGPGGRGEGGGGGRKFFRRKKVCKFCVEKIDSINYKDVRLLQQFVAERGKIVPRRLTGVCTPHQRRLTAAIKQARNIALLPFAARF
jgi:small subunit ribosomal protein S18